MHALPPILFPAIHYINVQPLTQIMFSTLFYDFNFVCMHVLYFYTHTLESETV